MQHALESRSIASPAGPGRREWSQSLSHTRKPESISHSKMICFYTEIRKETLEKVHAGHQGIECCQLRVKYSVWWPGVTKQMTEMIQQCPVCAKEATPRKEPLMITPLPDYPWQVIGTDLFELKGVTYLLVVDYFSRYREITKLTPTTSLAVFNALKSIFARHGIPEITMVPNMHRKTFNNSPSPMDFSI